MNIKKYEAFVMAAELGGLTKAAQTLGLTQSGMSHIISSLEAEFGFPLLVRNRNGARLTDSGEKILPLVRDILAKNRELEALVEGIRGLGDSTIRLGAFTSVAVNWLPGMIKLFQTDFPNVDFKLLSGDYHDMELWLSDGSLDAAFITLPGPADCRCVTLREDRLMAVLPAGHPLAELPAVPARAIAGEPFISLLESSDHDSRRALEKAGVKPNIKFTTKDDYAIIAMVESGLGVTIMPELLLRGHKENVAVRELEPPARRVIALAVPGSCDEGSATARFVEYAARWVRENVK